MVPFLYLIGHWLAAGMYVPMFVGLVYSCVWNLVRVMEMVISRKLRVLSLLISCVKLNFEKSCRMLLMRSISSVLWATRMISST